MNSVTSENTPKHSSIELVYCRGVGATVLKEACEVLQSDRRQEGRRRPIRPIIIHALWDRKIRPSPRERR